MIYDGGIEKVILAGAAEVRYLTKTEWTDCTPPEYAKISGPRDWNHVFCHDSITNETLLINLGSKNFYRFDLKTCTLLAQLDSFPDPQPISAFDQPWIYSTSRIFDPRNRRLKFQGRRDDNQRAYIDSGPCFEKAKSIGPRTTIALKTKSEFL